MVINPRTKDFIILLFAIIALGSMYGNLKLMLRCHEVHVLRPIILRPGPPIGNPAPVPPPVKESAHE